MIKKWFRNRRPTVDFNPETDVLYIARPDGTSHLHGPYDQNPEQIMVALYIKELFAPGPTAVRARDLLRSRIPAEILDELIEAASAD